MNFDLDAESLKENLGVIYDEIQEFQFENLSLIDHYTYKLKCNWKIALEANMEVYCSVYTSGNCSHGLRLYWKCKHILSKWAR